MTALGARHLHLHSPHPDRHEPPGLMDAPATPLGGRVTRRRAVGMAGVDRAQVDQVRAATGTTVNDVILALTSSALRGQLETSGELPERPLVAFVPVAVKGRGKAHDESVNQLSGMLVSLPTTTPDPLEQLVEVHANAGLAKVRERQMGSALFGSVAEILVPLLAGALNRAARMVGPLVGWPPFNVVVSSFPGSPVPLYCGGSRLVAYHPLGPVVDGSSLNVTAMTYGDTLQFGLLACGDILPQVDRIAARYPEALRELVKQVAA
jgi:diacylglycerol O-acyltransferase